MGSRTSLQFLGAAETVTGSRHLLSSRDRRILLDCGMSRGLERCGRETVSPFPSILADSMRWS